MCYLKPKYFSQARVPDPTKVCVAVGLGFFVELTLDEALAFVSKKDAALNKQVSNLSLKVIILHMFRLNSCQKSAQS